MGAAVKSRRPEHNGFPIREDGVKKLEVHVAGVCARETEAGWKILAAKRKQDRSLHPGLWEGGGGHFHPGESFEAALLRQMFEEFGLQVEPWYVLETYTIHVPTPQQIIPGVRYACLNREGDVRLNLREFSEYRWLDVPVIETLDWIPGVKQAVDRFCTHLLSRGSTSPYDDWDFPDTPE